MSLVPYHSKNTRPPARCRSASHSTPSVRHLFYQEFFSMGSKTLVRSYSNSQIFHSNGESIETVNMQTFSYISPVKNISLLKKSKSARVTEKEKESLKAPKHSSSKNKLNEQDEKKPESLHFRYAIYLLLLFIAYKLYGKIEYGYVWNLEKTSTELKNKIFGQNEAISRVISILPKFNSSEEAVTMIFTGGTGVGKTYTSSIISHNLPWSSNKLLFSKQISNDIKQASKVELSTFGCNLIIVDDLSDADTSDAVNFALTINSNIKKEKVLLIFIFSVTNDVSTNKILNKFNEAFIRFFHIPFKNLDTNAVENCFQAEIHRLGVVISSDQLKRLIAHRLKKDDITKQPSGCKGISEQLTSFIPHT